MLKLDFELPDASMKCSSLADGCPLDQLPLSPLQRLQVGHLTVAGGLGLMSAAYMRFAVEVGSLCEALVEALVSTMAPSRTACG